MPLALIDLSALIRQHTDKFIQQHLQFNILKDACISLTAVPNIFAAVQEELASHFKTDKQTISDHLTAAALKRQTIQDKVEDDKDQNEARDDLSSYESLNKESAKIEKQRDKRGGEITNEEEKIKNLDELIKDVASLLIIAKEQLSNEELKHRPNPQPQPGNPPVAEPHVTIHLPNTYQYEPQIRKANDKKIKELQDKIKELEGKEKTYSHNQKELEASVRTKKALQAQDSQRLKAIKNEVEVILPEKQEQRDARLHARIERANARSLQNDPKHLQLSLYNRLQLQQAVAKKVAPLKERFDELSQQTKEGYYLTYLERLAALLPYSGLHTLEIEALNQIRTLMLEYRATRQAEQVQKEFLQVTTKQKQEVEQRLQQEQDKAGQLKDSEPQLNGANQQLEENNQHLENSIATRRKSRNTYLKLSAGSGAFTGVASGVGGAVIAAKGTAITLTAISPAIGLGAATLFLAGAAAVKGYNSYRDRKKINNNLLEITNNRNTLEQNSLQFNSIKDSVIPSLEEEIRQLGYLLGKTILDIRELDEKANLLLNKAKNVHAPSFKGNSFLAERASPPAYTELESAVALSTAPSAPPRSKVFGLEEEVIEDEPVTASVRL